MKNLLLVTMPILFSIAPGMAQEEQQFPKWGLVSSITMFNAAVVDSDDYFNFSKTDNTSVDIGYALQLSYRVNSHLFLESGLGYSKIKNAHKQQFILPYTTSNSSINTDELVVNEYQLQVNNGVREVSADVTLVTKKIGDEFDYNEGDDLEFEFVDDYIYQYVQLPVTANYKLSKKRLSLVFGLGPRVNFSIKDPISNKRFRQSANKVDVENDHRYLDLTDFNYKWDRNSIESVTTTTKDLTKPLFWEAQFKLGLIHEDKRNTFFLNLVYSRSLGSFSPIKQLEQLGVTAGWRFHLIKKPVQRSHTG